jgi:hypothetical protein
VNSDRATDDVPWKSLQAWSVSLEGQCRTGVRRASAGESSVAGEYDSTARGGEISKAVASTGQTPGREAADVLILYGGEHRREGVFHNWHSRIRSNEETGRHGGEKAHNPTRDVLESLRANNILTLKACHIDDQGRMDLSATLARKYPNKKRTQPVSRHRLDFLIPLHYFLLAYSGDSFLRFSS